MSQHMLTCKLEFSPFTENSFCFGRLNALFCLIIESWFLQIGSTQENFEDGVVKREDLWITSKLRFYCLLTLLKIVMFLNVENGAVGVKPENVIQHDIPSTWRAMEELYDSGKAKAIGVTNFSSKKPQDLWDIAGVPPTVNQVECHPQWQQLKLHEFCASKEIHLSVCIAHKVILSLHSCNQIELLVHIL